jgi:hypothetical protein
MAGEKKERKQDDENEDELYDKLIGFKENLTVYPMCWNYS